MPEQPEPNAFEAAEALADQAESARRRTEVQRNAAYEKLKERGVVGRRPIREASDPFSKWLRMQTQRHDRIGALARVATRDPQWPVTGFAHRSALTDYFLTTLGARSFVVQTAGLAWDEWEQTKKRARNRDKRQQQKQSRKANRRGKRK